jgi:hypothetical protein
MSHVTTIWGLDTTGPRCREFRFPSRKTRELGSVESNGLQCIIILQLRNQEKAKKWERMNEMIWMKKNCK